MSDWYKPESAAQLLETLNTAVLVLDHRLLLVYLNPAAENLFEISRRQITGHYWPDMIRASEPLVNRLKETLNTRHPFTERELELHTATGQRMTVDCIVTPSGREDLLLEIMQVDRHLRIAHEEHLLVQQQAARELLRGMAHEIKNPLGGLRGAAQLLESELHDDGLKEYTRVIIGEADRLTHLVDRMLGPNNVLENRIINIHQVLEHVRSLVDAESYPGLELLREYDPSIPEFRADSELLIQAVLNLVRNAAQAGAKKMPHAAPVHDWPYPLQTGGTGRCRRRWPGHPCRDAGKNILPDGNGTWWWYGSWIVHCTVHDYPAPGHYRIQQ